jgi:methylthioribose-1-phosphate isomerase
VASNGDTANKISTYQISLLCHHVPQVFQPKVVICAPLTTLDLSMDTGKHIVIEQRPEWEACTARGKRFAVDGQKSVAGEGEEEVLTVLITPEGTRAWNPAFDVTPGKLIDGQFIIIFPLEKITLAH